MRGRSKLIFQCAGAFFTASRIFFLLRVDERSVGCAACSVISKASFSKDTLAASRRLLTLKPVALGVESSFPPLVRTQTEGTMFWRRPILL